jgi:SAM-dependent methyltransferase
MPTVPPERTPFGGRESHQAREIAESFGSDPDRYDRARPRYPGALIDRIAARTPGGTREGRPGPYVLDVGCGTGIVARQFLAAGCRVLGVDPDERMAGLARRHGLEVEVATFETWPSAGREFDAVVAGQSWHWVDPAAGAAKAARALRPGGRLAVFWNAFEPPRDVADAFLAVYRRVIPESPLVRGAAGTTGPDAYQGPCARAADGMREAGAFGPPEQWRFGWDRPYTRDEWLDQVPTSGFWAQIPAAGQRELLAGIGTAVDAAGGGFTMRYVTVAVTATRTATTAKSAGSSVLRSLGR